MKRELTPAQVWDLISEGCNTDEIAAYAGVAHFAAVAMVNRAARMYADVRMVA